MFFSHVPNQQTHDWAWTGYKKVRLARKTRMVRTQRGKYGPWWVGTKAGKYVVWGSGPSQWTALQSLEWTLLEIRL